MKKVLIVDDDSMNGEVFRDALTGKFEVQIVQDCDTAKRYMHTHQFDLVILDYFLRGESGAKLARDLRSQIPSEELPILFVSGSIDIREKEDAFNSGADDYLARPYDNKELILRMERLLENVARHKKSNFILSYGNLRISLLNQRVYVGDSTIDVTGREFSILCYLVSNNNRIVTSQELIEHVWGNSQISVGNIHTQIHNLKNKLRDFNGNIQTLNRVGLKLTLNDVN